MKAKVFCTDDNPMVSEAVRLHIEDAADFEFVGAAASADGLLEAAAAKGCPDVVLLDIDMPGKDPFEAIGALAALCAKARVLMYSGVLRRDLIERAMEAGAWGCIAKADGCAALLDSMRRALRGEFVLSPEAQAAYQA